ncbi:TonB family protein [Aminobacter sp. AP02]|uniref:energy transducer TonB n=1 Tax=Aminobacter sp. AP02 TaxID=2135737 RepID=UPI000D6D9910|nr:TonB family protein [Aminobacter sp. AP02]PWK74061.1 protein TonB [Aminobacter sp. AP02]
MSMATHDDFSFGGVNRREAVLWSAAAAVIVSAHMAGAWYLHQQPVTMMMDEPQGQTAVMIDLAPMALAPEAVPQETADLVDAQAAESVEPTETVTPDAVEPETTPVEEIAQEVPEPVQEIAESEPVEEVVPDLVEAPLPEVAMAMPQPRPEFEEPEPVAKPVPKKKKIEKKPEPVKQAKVEKKQSANSAASQKSAQKSETTRAPAAGQGGGKAMSQAQWLSKVFSRIARHKGRATGNGSVNVRFTFTASGDILSAAVTSSSGNPKLDQIALNMVRRASPIPTPPPSAPLYLTAPITFEIR